MCSALQLYVDLERLLEAVSIVSLSSRAPDPYRSPPFFCNCQESSEHCNFVLPLTGWRLQHPSSSRRVTCDPVVLDVRTVLILQVHLLLYCLCRAQSKPACDSFCFRTNVCKIICALLLHLSFQQMHLKNQRNHRLYHLSPPQHAMAVTGARADFDARS